ncbi:MAG TPA: SDR family NAD(P)-dependent oxidoreductase [Gemmatimonadales bacterium]|nr:SDR family NAD(P)-dependent oxidoreductase [Gemmatimonadales bacterium]
MTAHAGKDRIAMVSGGNRGIGFEICHGLAKLGLRVAMGSRDVASGQRALETIDAALRDLIVVVQLDVTDANSVQNATARMEEQWGRIDVLVNNAGVYLDESENGETVSMDVVRVTLETNLVGALRLSQAVIPGMRARRYGRIVNVSSGYGACSAMDSGGVLAYKLAKLGLNGMTRILAAELKGTGVLVNAMDPGWVRTRMGGRSAHRTPQQGADTALYLATLPSNGPTGGFFHDRRQVSW